LTRPGQNTEQQQQQWWWRRRQQVKAAAGWQQQQEAAAGEGMVQPTKCSASCKTKHFSLFSHFLNP